MYFDVAFTSCEHAWDGILPAWEDSSQQKLCDLASDCRCSIVELIDADSSGLQSVEPHHVTMSTKSSLSNAEKLDGDVRHSFTPVSTAAMLRDFLHAERDTTDQE